MSNRKRKKAQKNTAVATLRKETGSNVTSISGTSKEVARRPSLPTHTERIVRRRAYELYEERGREDGHAEEDWMRAEAEVLGTMFRGQRVG